MKYFFEELVILCALTNVKDQVHEGFQANVLFGFGSVDFESIIRVDATVNCEAVFRKFLRPLIVRGEVSKGQDLVTKG